MSVEEAMNDLRAMFSRGSVSIEVADHVSLKDERHTKYKLAVTSAVGGPEHWRSMQAECSTPLGCVLTAKSWKAANQL